MAACLSVATRELVEEVVVDAVKEGLRREGVKAVCVKEGGKEEGRGDGGSRQEGSKVGGSGGVVATVVGGRVGPRCAAKLIPPDAAKCATEDGQVD